MTFDFDHDDPESVAVRIANGLHKLGLAQRHQAWRGATDRGLTPTQEQLLVALKPHRDGLRVSRLADLLAVSVPTVSDAVATLEGKGLVARKPAPDDGRAVLVRLTAKGRRSAEQAARWGDYLVAAVDTLDAAEQAVFLTALVRMVRALQVDGQVPVARMCVTCRYFQPNAHASRTKPHHCAFVDAAFGPQHTRVDCSDHQPAEPEQVEAAFAAWDTHVRAARKR